MLSVINLVPTLAAVPPSVQNIVPQHLVPQFKQDAMDFTTFMLGLHSIIDPFVRVAPYRAKLSSSASFSTKIIYCLFRIWNAVKAIFNQSEWQCAKRQLTEGPFTQFILNIAEDALGDDEKFELFKEMIEKEAEFLLLLSIDNKASNADSKQSADYAQHSVDLLRDCFKDVNDAVTDVYNANQAAIQQNLIPQLMANHQNNPQNVALLLGMGIPMGMQVIDKLGLQDEMKDLIAGQDRADVLRGIYTKMAPQIKEFQTRMLELVAADDMMEQETIEAAKKRDDAENHFFEEL